MNGESRNIKLQNEKMDLVASTEDERKAHLEEKPSYPKRASVVELWRKRESAIKASSSISKGRTRPFGYEEKKEAHQPIDSESEKDARQQGGNPDTFVHPTGSDRNGPEPTTDTAVDVGTAKIKSESIYAPKRSNIRDSWKKKATYVPSPHQSPGVGKIVEIENPVLDSSTNSTQLNTKPENKSIPSTIEKPHTPLSAGSAANITKASPSPFDELKSKWAKFGVQKDRKSEVQSPLSPKISASTLKAEPGIADKSEDKSVVKLSPMRQYSKTKNTRDQRSPARTPLVIRTREESTQVSTTEGGSSVNSPSLSKEVAKQNSPSSETRSTFLAARRFRSRYGRRPASTKNCTTDETTGLTTNPSTDLADKNVTSSPTKNCTTDKTIVLTKSPSTDLEDKNATSPSVLKKEPIDSSIPTIEKELVPSFPLDETIPVNSPPVSTGPIAASVAQNQNNMTASRSSLSSRASQRLRDIRKKTRTKEEIGSPTNRSNDPTHIVSPAAHEKDLEDSKFQDPGRIPLRPSRSLQRNRTNESYASTFVSQDDCSESTYGNSQMNSTHASVFTTDSTVAESKSDEKVPLRDAVLDVDGMIPAEFVSENNTNFKSFKTAYDNTSFGQIAKDITEEASVGMDVAMNTLGELFQLNSPKKMIRRAPSPVEEVAIEVEYVADTD